MRPCFSDESRLLTKAKENVETGFSQVKQWWVKKYKLPANHDLFQNQSMAELSLEMYEDMLLRREEIMEQLETASPKVLSGLYEQLNSINVALGEPPMVQDELVERWERELEQGIMPDLNER